MRLISCSPPPKRLTDDKQKRWNDIFGFYYQSIIRPQNRWLLLLLLLLRRAPRVLGVGPLGRSWGLRVGAKHYRRWVAGGHRDYVSTAVCGSSLHSGHVGSAAGPSTWAYALRSGVCLDRRRARRTASALLEVAMQSTFQEKCSYTIAVRGLLDETVGLPIVDLE